MLNKVFGISALSAFFISGVYFDIGFALKPFIVAGLIAGFVITVNYKNVIQLRGYDYLFLVLLFYGALAGAIFNPQMPLLRIVSGVTLYYLCYLCLSSFLCARYGGSYDLFVREIILTGIVITTFSLGLYAFTLITTPKYILANVEYQNILYGLEYDRGVYRLKGLSHDPNVAALTAIFFISAAVFLRSGSAKWRIPLGALSVVMLFMTASRAGILAVVLLVAYFVASERRFPVTLNRRSFLFATALFLIAAVVGMVLGPDLIEVVAQRQKNFFSGSGRIALWQHAIEEGLRAPLLGVGWFEYVSSNRFVHNTYLEVIVELGAIGFLLYFCLLALIATELRRLSFCHSGGEFVYYYFLGFLICAFFLSIFLHETFFLVMILIKVYHAQRRYANDRYIDNQ